MESKVNSSLKSFFSHHRKIILFSFASPTIWITIISCAIFLIQVRLDPDAHHDGIIFAAGLAFSEGLLPNVDFFSQYGPLHVALSGLSLMALGEQVLSLRILTAFFLVATTTIMFKIIRKKSSDSFAFGISVYWCLSCPTFILAATTPWPSVLTTLISMTIIYVIGDGSRNHFIVSILIVLGTLCRIQYAALGVLIFGVILLENWKTNRTNVKIWFLALTISFSCTAMLLELLGILPHYIEETIYWAFGTYGRNSISFDSAGVIKLIDLMWIPFITLLTYLIHRCILVKKLRPFILLSIMVIMMSNIIFSFDLVRSPRSSFYSVGFVIDYVTRNLVESGLFLTLGITVLQLMKSIKNIFRSFPDTRESLIYCVGLTAILQLFPQWDLMHIWWVSPIFLVIACRIIISESKVIVGALIFFVGLAGIQTSGYLFEPRKAYSDSILSGSIGKQELVDSVGRSLLNLESLGENKKVRFDCDHSLYAGFGGNYHSSSHSYVNWGPGFNDSSKTDQGVFYCNVLTGSQTLNLVDLNIENFATLMPDGSWNVFIARE